MDEYHNIKLKIFMVIARYHPYIGGAEIQAQRLSEALKSNGYEVTVLTQQHAGLKRKESINSVSINRLFSLGSGKVGSFTFFFSLLFYIIKNITKFDIIHTHLASSPAIVAAIVGRIFRKRTILKFGGGVKVGEIATSEGRFLGRWKIKILRKNIDQFVCPNREILANLISRRFKKEKLLLIHNGVNIDFFKPLSGEQKKALKKKLNLENKKVVTFIGRLEPEKDICVLIKNLEMVIKKYDDVYLLIIGDGSQRKYSEELVQKLDIEESIRFTGFLNSEKVREYLQASDVFVLPSIGEGLSNALLEAMACGLSTVATETGGNIDVIINEDNGMLVEPQNHNQFIEKVSYLLANAETSKKIGQKARETVVAKFSLSRITESYIDLYNRLSAS